MLKFFLGIRRRALIRPARQFRRRAGGGSAMLAMAILIGILAGAASVGLHLLVLAFDWCCENLSAWASTRGFWIGVTILLLPLCGMGLSFLVQKFFGGSRYAKSLSPLILMLNRRKYNIPGREMFSHIFSSALSVGFGGSAGLEAPSVLAGSAIGANACRFLGAERRNRPLMIGCGAAAAISAIFDSPVGGVLFAVEVLMPEFSVAALIPMVMSSAIATVTSRILIAKHGIFSLPVLAPWRVDAVPCYFICGVLSALVGVYVIRLAYGLGGQLKKRIPQSAPRLFISGLLLCLLLFFFPLLRGQGYGFVELLFHGGLPELTGNSPLALIFGNTGIVIGIMLFAAVFLKVVASVLTVDGGGDGGIFAPSMFTGAFLGFAFARLVNLTGAIELQEDNFVIAGMCGVFTAVMRAPLTGIFLIAEVTGGYELLVPLMIVSGTSWFTAGFLEPNSIYRKVLAESKLLSDDRDRDLLQRLPVRLSVQRDFIALRPTDPLRKLIQLVEHSGRRDAYPVLDESGSLLGVVLLEKVLAAMLEPGLADTLLVFDLMSPPRGVVAPDDDLDWAMINMERFSLDLLPVVDETDRFQGFLRKDDVFVRYRRSISEA